MTDYLFQLPDKRERKLSGTLQAQIQEMVVGAILSQQLPAGCSLPSGRKLAQQLKVSRNTVILAYLNLMDEGFISSRERRGFYVREDVLNGYAKIRPKKIKTPTNSIDWDKKISLKSGNMRYLKRREDWQKYPYPFLYSQYSKKIFPVADWRKCVREASGLSAIYEWAGDHSDHDSPELIKQIHQKLLPRRGIYVEPEEILITVGSQHAIYLIANLLLDANKTIGMENPGYADARNTFLTKTEHVKLIKVDKDGLVVDAHLKGCDCVFTTPSHQYPTTVTMPKERRKALLASANENDFIVIEDDYESELNYKKTPIPALKSMDKEGRVLHLGSLSKTLAPGIRLGFLVGPKGFIQQARALRRLMLRHPPSNNQYIIGLFLKRGYHDALIRKMRTTLHHRSQLMASLLDEHFPQAFPRLVFGGSAYWIEAPHYLDTELLAQKAKQSGILIESGTVFFAENTPVKHFFRLGFSSISSEAIERGIPLLAKLIKTMIS